MSELRHRVLYLCTDKSYGSEWRHKARKLLIANEFVDYVYNYVFMMQLNCLFPSDVAKIIMNTYVGPLYSEEILVHIGNKRRSRHRYFDNECAYRSITQPQYDHHNRLMVLSNLKFRPPSYTVRQEFEYICVRYRVRLLVSFNKTLLLRDFNFVYPLPCAKSWTPYVILSSFSLCSRNRTMRTSNRKQYFQSPTVLQITSSCRDEEKLDSLQILFV